MDSKRPIKLDPSWLDHLEEEFSKPYMVQLRKFLLEEKMKGKEIFPPGEETFNALNTTPFNKVKVVIIGQDPYHGPGQAHGLCFSVKPGIQPPPSLVNIFKEIHEDLGCRFPNHGYLMDWAEQGVLLINAVLSVEAHQAASHRNRGWEAFTDKVIQILSNERKHLVFLLWGSYAQSKSRLIDGTRHLILKAPHPSPLSAYRGFLGCRHFSQCNEYLATWGESPIDWSLKDLSVI